MPRLLDFSFARFPRVPDFVIQYIRDRDLDDEEYIDGQTLIQLCMDEFCDPDQMRDNQAKKNAKDDIVASVKRMVAEGVLLYKSRDRRALFRLPVEQLVEEPSTIIVEQRDRNAEDAETSLLEDDAIEDSELDRHAAGYAEMTRRALPLVEAPAEEDMSTPSRKRRRIEIAASESSRWNSLSPSQHRNSTPRRRPHRPDSPLSGSRRRSAPIQMVSPVKPRETRDYDDEDLRQKLFKKENKDTSPPWLHQGLSMLRARYPDDHFQAINGMVECIDCGREFKPQNHGVTNFETHLRSKSHRALVAKKLECGSAYQEVAPSKKFAMDLNETHTSYVVFPSKGEQSTAELGRQYFAAIHNEHHQGSIRVSFLERKVADAEKSIASQRETFEKTLEASEESINEAKEKFNLLSEVLKSTADKCDDQNRTVVERLDASLEKNDELLRDMKKQIVKFEDVCGEKLDETNSRVARNFQRTTEQYDKVKEYVSKSESLSKTKLEHLTTQISQLTEQNNSQEEEMTVLRSKIEEQQTDFQDLESHSQQLTCQVEELQQANKFKDEEIQDLLSQSQLHTEELQRQRDSSLSFQKTLTEQMEAHVQQSERTMKKLAAEHEERLKALEQKLLDRIITSSNESTKKIRSVERKTADQSERLERFETVIPTIFEEVNGMLGSIDEISERVIELQDAAEESQAVKATKWINDGSRRRTVAR